MFDGTASIATAVLWQTDSNGNEQLLAFGDRAIEEWGFRTDSERRKCRISTVFKPDISLSERAREDARAFLTALVEHIRREGVLPPDIRQAPEVNIGVPAVQAEGFVETLTALGQSLNLGNLRTVPEPVGALITHVAMRHDLSPGDARSGVLVIDFGGGTCDVAYMFRLDVKTAWGDPLLGGRLFDDLFYQWFLDLNPEIVDDLSHSQDEYFVHWIVCREMKERFSITMNRDRNAKFSHHVHVADIYYGGMNGVTWEEFIERARTYRPSESIRRVLKTENGAPWREGSDRYDLIDWFRTVIAEGINERRIRPEDIRYVILTGGSSAWPFVKDMIEEILQVETGHLFFSANPMTAVGEGIALLPVIQQMHARARERIQAERDGAIQEILRRIDRLAETFSRTIADEIVDVIVNDEMRRVLSEFSRRGGSLEDLKQRISETVGKRSADCDAIIRRHEDEILAAVNMEVVDVLDAWFRENGIRNWSSDRHYLEKLGVSGPDASGLTLDDPLFDMVRTLGHLVMIYGVGSLMGGGGIALLIPGLPGVVLGAVIGVFVSALGFEVLKKPIRKTVDKVVLPSWAASMLYSDRRLDKMVSRLRKQLHHDILQNARNVFENRMDELKPFVEELVDTVIEDLTALDHL